MIADVGVWLDDEGPAMRGASQAAERLRANATQTVFAMADGLYRQLSEVCRTLVAEAAAVPELPQSVWSATSTAGAAELAIGANCEDAWVALVRCGIRWDAVHAAAQIVRECGTLQGQLIFNTPTGVACQFLRPELAVDGLDEVKRLPAPLRLRAAIDRGWRPGLYLKVDHDAAAAEATKQLRGLFAALSR